MNNGILLVKETVAVESHFWFCIKCNHVKIIIKTNKQQQTMRNHLTGATVTVLRRCFNFHVKLVNCKV